ncbi:pilus assembly protein PilX [Roseateles sp. DC23W]|uniref:Pilus assembly protein PilX n=1 Tax=Pelomonas dachongensis TaxID=3299029 RepID=A0ABW7ERS3_9BURK
MITRRKLLIGRERYAERKAQRGLSLLFALLALVAISLAAVALIRSVDTSSLVIGNLGFKQDATSAASQAAEQAIAYLNTASATTLNSDQPAAGYYAASRDALDVTGQGSSLTTRAVVDWTGSGNCALYASTSFGTCVAPSSQISLNGGANTARYLITRLCATEGAPSAIDCATPIGSALTGGGNKGSTDYNKRKVEIVVTNAQYYRIVVRSTSARGTVSFTETIIQR